MEFSQGRGWLFEVQRDLVWMQSLVALPAEVPALVDDWPEFWHSLRDCHHWKSLVKKACKKHLLQERIARDVDHYHHLITAELSTSGFHLLRGDEHPDLPDRPLHRCPDCPMTFPSKQALASHAYQVHGQQSCERQYIQSTVCPGCLRDHHTTWRLQQHLRYRPNGCFDRIDGARLPDVPITIRLPSHLRHIKRLPAVRRHAGPLRPTSGQRHRIVLAARIAKLRAEGDDCFAWWHPERDPGLVQRAFEVLRAGLAEWCAMLEHTTIDFQNILFNALFDLHIPDLLAGRLFVHWIETEFHNLWPLDLHPDSALLLEKAHLDMLADIPAWRFRQQMKDLTNLWIHRPPDYPDLPVRPEVLQPRGDTRLHPIVSHFAQLGVREQARASWRLLSRPRPVLPASRGPYYVIHLYSGRRREGDFHEAMAAALSSFGELDIRLLSLDTAVHSSMNIHDPQLWAFLIQIARAGRVLGLLQGPPCETWTSARHNLQVDGDGNPLRGPRPLRSADDLWGIAHLTFGELSQIFTGNILLLKGLLLACLVTMSGGATMLEHPATPFDESFASIWRLNLIQLLLRYPYGPFKRISIEQWRFGSVGIKPTTFLYSNTELPKALSLNEDPHALRPTSYLIGKTEEGAYRTAKAKEYPIHLNRAFADALTSSLAKWTLANPPHGGDGDAGDAAVNGADRIEPLGLKLAELAASAEHGKLLPDYQPKS
eukprot:s1176_g16.t1